MEGNLFGLRLKALLAAWPEATEESPAALLLRTFAHRAPTGTLSLRYLYDPQQSCGQVGAVLLGRVEDNAAQAAQSLARWLRVQLKCHSFEPLNDDELSYFLAPFSIADVTEFTRQVVLLDIASWDLAVQEPIGFKSDAEAKTPPERCPTAQYSLCPVPFAPNPAGWVHFFELLFEHPAPVFVDLAFWPTSLPAPLASALEEQIRRCEDYTRAFQSNRGKTRTAPTLALRAEIIRDRFLALRHLLEGPGHAFWVRIRMASAESIPPELIAAFSQALTHPLKFDLAQRGQYLSGGYAWFRYQGVPQEVREALAILARDMGVVQTEPLRYLFDLGEAAQVLYLPKLLPEARSFPGLPVRCARVVEAPESLPREGIRLGHAQRRKDEVPVILKTDDHRRHVYAIGQTGVGKSSLLLKMAMECIRRGDGVAVIDPHGDLVQLLVRCIPDERVGDVILFDPGDPEYAMGLNLLEWRLEEERAFLADEMISMLRKLYHWEHMGPMFEHNVRYALLLLMSDPDEPGTLVQLPRLFIDRGFHERWLPKVQDPLVRQFWTKDFPMADYSRENYHHYIISKFDQFITNPLMRTIIGQPRSTLNIEEIMNQGKILVVDLAKGKLGEINAFLLGMILMAKIYSTALRRVNIPRSQRRDFFVFVDEFQSLATPTFANILSEARKFRVTFTLCNQYIAQLPKEITSAILGNVGTLVVFRVGLEDAALLEPYFQMAGLGREALASQPNHHAYIRLLVDGELTPPFSFYTELETLRPDGEEVYQRIVAQSRARYARPRQEVEQEIARGLERKAQSLDLAEELEKALFPKE